MRIDPRLHESDLDFAEAEREFRHDLLRAETAIKARARASHQRIGKEAHPCDRCRTLGVCNRSDCGGPEMSCAEPEPEPYKAPVWALILGFGLSAIGVLACIAWVGYRVALYLT